MCHHLVRIGAEQDNLLSCMARLGDDLLVEMVEYQAKRSLEIAAAGGHNVLMVGVSGSSKTMLVR